MLTPRMLASLSGPLNLFPNENAGEPMLWPMSNGAAVGGEFRKIAPCIAVGKHPAVAPGRFVLAKILNRWWVDSIESVPSFPSAAYNLHEWMTAHPKWSDIYVPSGEEATLRTWSGGGFTKRIWRSRWHEVEFYTATRLKAVDPTFSPIFMPADEAQKPTTPHFETGIETGIFYRRVAVVHGGPGAIIPANIIEMFLADTYEDQGPQRARREVTSALHQAVPDLSTEAECPADGCHRRTSLWGLVQHVNDHHRWNRNRIADWLETLDFDLTIKGEKR